MFIKIDVKYIITVKISSKSPEYYQGNLGINLISKSSNTGFINLDHSIAKGSSRKQSNKKLFRRGQKDIFEFEDRDMRALSAVILSKDIKGENVLFIDFIQIDLQRSTETQSYRFPFDGWLCSARQEQKSENLKSKFGLKNSIIIYPNELPKYEYIIQISPSISKKAEYKIEINYQFKPIDRLVEYTVEFDSDLPTNGRLRMTLFGLLGQSQQFNFTNKIKQKNQNNKYKISNNEIGEIKYALVNFDDKSRNKEYYLKGFKIIDEENGLTY